MSDPFVGEIRMFAGNFAPRGWAFCNGQLLAINQNNALFSLFGTIYGGDGSSTFGLPELRGRIPLHQGTGPGLSNRKLGSKSGEEKVTLSVNQLPSHTHALNASSDTATDGNPANKTHGQTTTNIYASAPTGPISMDPNVIGNSGGTQPHSNIMPSLCVNFIVALVGIFPSRN